MKSKFISMVALIVSVGAFFVSIAFLTYRIKSDMSYSAIIYQLIATGLISIICFFNVIYLFTQDDETDENDEDIND
ncbi:MAG: hypothetical protein IJ015_01910 [Ruminococcus sp.]|nr:hypothetical protein [Ruminococcus sp.]